MQGLIILIPKHGWLLRKVLCNIMHVKPSNILLHYSFYIEEAYCRKAFDPNAPGLASLQWDSAELLQIGVQDQMSYDDAFTMEEVAIV